MTADVVIWTLALAAIVAVLAGVVYESPEVRVMRRRQRALEAMGRAAVASVRAVTR